MTPKKTYVQLTVHSPPFTLELLKSLVFNHSCTGTEEYQNGFRAYFPDGFSKAAVRGIIPLLEQGIRISGLREDFTWTVAEIPHADWLVLWKEKFRPIEIGAKLVVIAP